MASYGLATDCMAQLLNDTSPKKYLGHIICDIYILVVQDKEGNDNRENGKYSWNNMIQKTFGLILVAGASSINLIHKVYRKQAEQFNSYTFVS